MNIVKVLDDYSKTDDQRELVEYLKGVLPSPCADVRRVLR